MGMAALLREPLKFQSVDRFLGPRTTGRVKFTSAHSSTDVTNTMVLVGVVSNSMQSRSVGIIYSGVSAKIVQDL